ncbi:hypothetical protein JMJ35_001010 [Cladonia borealis]|uniref:Rrn9 domain-containing protein n=1 Tax=Cladonia borealis TaxID=184061 RepID=A0AA39R7N4_9LECA|nr:hypothetical protein JMJ35_001010 [Cladonia borealis]
MSSTSKQSRSQSPNEPFQPAQRPRNDVAVDDGDLDLASESASSATSPVDALSSEVLEGNHTGADDTASEGAQEASGNGQEQALPTSTPPPSRPNKYRGPASTWRNWTAPERELVASLDQLTAKDLSVHLYNIFKLKQKRSAKQRSQLPKLDEDDADMYDADLWVPPRVWTAWPLAPEAVPRDQRERKWVEPIVLPPPYIVRREMPGDILRELLEAEVLRKARLKFAERPWADIDDDDENELTNMKPVVMTDDQRASKILRPTIHAILARLDSLLMGLHSARNASLAFDDSGNESQSQTRVRSISQPRSRKRKRVASGTDAVTASASERAMTVSETDTSFASKTVSRLRGRANRSTSFSQTSNNGPILRRKSRLALRDWSDILGVASMTGWEPAVIEKAATRCASFFEECITFRTLKEGDEGHIELCYTPVTSTPLLVTKKEGTDQKARKGTLGGVHLDGFLEPIEGKKSWKYQSNGSGQGPGRPRSKH